jgi:YesN/AraC family two-component response regulator
MREEGTNLEKEHGESEKYVLASEILLDRDETTDDLSGYRSKPESVLPENAKPLLLLVDDNKDILYYLQTLLEDEYSIETAYNGQDGISLALEIIPDIIISDVLMPEKDGYELCELLKSNELTNHIPIILLTAKSDSVARVTGFKKGADAYISKPFDENELKAQLENLLRIRKSLQKHFSVLASNKDSKEDKKVVEDPFLVKLNEIIHHNMEDEDFGILQLCRAMQMSRTQLHRKITALTGKSTSIYIRYLRLHQAKQLLKKPEMNISEVAFAVGFSDPNYFTRTFTEEFGITPSGYRSGV